MIGINEALESFSTLPEDKKNIVIEFISKITQSSKMKNQRLELEERRKEIDKGESLSHHDFWQDV